MGGERRGQLVVAVLRIQVKHGLERRDQRHLDPVAVHGAQQRFEALDRPVGKMPKFCIEIDHGRSHRRMFSPRIMRFQSSGISAESTLLIWTTKLRPGMSEP